MRQLEIQDDVARDPMPTEGVFRFVTDVNLQEATPGFPARLWVKYGYMRFRNGLAVAFSGDWVVGPAPDDAQPKA